MQSEKLKRAEGAPSEDKPVALVSASLGVLGGFRSQLGLQVVLDKLGVLVVPDSFALGAAHQAFDAHGGLKDPNVEKAVRGVGAALVAMVARR